MPHKDSIELGRLTLHRLAHEEAITGQTIARAQATGVATMYTVEGPAGFHLTIRDVAWTTGERDVAVWDRRTAPQRFDRLRSGLRLQVESRGDHLYVELRQARLKENDWSNLFAADEGQLDAGAGVAVVQSLKSAGAIAVDTREVLLKDEGPARHRFGAIFPQRAQEVPAVAYVLTRIAPLWRGIQA